MAGVQLHVFTGYNIGAFEIINPEVGVHSFFFRNQFFLGAIQTLLVVVIQIYFFYFEVELIFKFRFGTKDD